MELRKSQKKYEIKINILLVRTAVTAKELLHQWESGPRKASRVSHPFVIDINRQFRGLSCSKPLYLQHIYSIQFALQQLDYERNQSQMELIRCWDEADLKKQFDRGVGHL